MLHLIAVITAKPGQRDALLAIFRANVPNVQAEPGCIEYAAAVDAGGFAGMQAPLGPEARPAAPAAHSRPGIAGFSFAEPCYAGSRQAARGVCPFEPKRALCFGFAGAGRFSTVELHQIGFECGVRRGI
jgi:hypothetical protein